MPLNHRARLSQAVSAVLRQLEKGIGTSKRAAIHENGGKSPLIHSHATLKRYTGIIREFSRFVQKSGTNRINHLSYSHIQGFLQSKIDKNYSEKTISVNAAALNKFFEALGKNDLAEQLRQDLPGIKSEARSAGRALAFAEPAQMIERLENYSEASGLIAQIQLNTGSRIEDVPKVEVRGNHVAIEGSKGGKDRYLDFSNRLVQLEAVRSASDALKEKIGASSWDALKTQYYTDLKLAVQDREIYSGSHAFRVNYAKKRYAQLVDSGKNHHAALKIVTQELGHERMSMARYYLAG